MNTTHYPQGPTEAEESLCCAEPRTGLNSCNNAIALDLRCVSSQILERFSPEQSSVIVNFSTDTRIWKQICNGDCAEEAETTWEAEYKSRCSPEKMKQKLWVMLHNLILWMLVHKLIVIVKM